MSGVDDVRPVSLPEGMADGLRDLAAARTAGTTPWPRMRSAVRRDRRRRAVGASAAAAGLVAATILAATTLLPESAAPSPPPAGRDRRTETPGPTRPTPSEEPSAPSRALGPDADPLNLTGATAGSLATDEGWLLGLRRRVVEDEEAAPDVARVRVLWAADHAGQRHALTVSLTKATQARLTLWRGDAGAPPEDLHVERRRDAVFRNGRPFVPANLYQLRTREGRDGPGLILATGTNLMAVEVPTGADYDAAGRRVVTWAPLQPQGAVFVRVASDAEIDEMAARAATTDAQWFTVEGGGSYDDEPAPLPPGLVAVSAADADQQVLTCAARAFSPQRRGFPAGSDPVLGVTRRAAGEWYGIAVVRAPSGGYLVGMCRVYRPDRAASASWGRIGGFVVPAPAGGARDLLVLVPCRLAPGGADAKVVCVVAPEGATQVEVGGVRAAVRDRVAVVEFPQPVPLDGMRATAYRANGEVLGPVKKPAAEETVTREGLPQTHLPLTPP
jgi:hypothetical protein